MFGRADDVDAGSHLYAFWMREGRLDLCNGSEDGSISYWQKAFGGLGEIGIVWVCGESVIFANSHWLKNDPIF